MDILKTFFAEHLDDSDNRAGEPERVLRMESMATRFILFRVGQLRFALASTDVAAVTRGPEAGCEYLSAAVAAPARYQSAAVAGPDHQSYIHLAGTRFGLGPCKADGDVVLAAGEVTRRGDAANEPWIAGTIAHPPSLVLDREQLCRRLLAAAGA